MKQDKAKVYFKLHWSYIFAILYIVFTLQGCSSTKLTALPQDGVILAFGDSLTYGTGVKQSQSYPAVLEELTGIKVVNSGVSGETTDEGLKRLPGVLDKVSPDLLILIEGGNDILRNSDLAQTKRNLASMIELAQQRGVQVVLLGVPEKSLFSNSADLYSELAKEYQLVFDNSLIAELQRSPPLKSDPVHFNQAGYRKMAESIHALLLENGGLREKGELP
jgi:lysophospholipase L1-like esterase